MKFSNLINVCESNKYIIGYRIDNSEFKIWWDSIYPTTINDKSITINTVFIIDLKEYEAKIANLFIMNGKIFASLKSENEI